MIDTIASHLLRLPVGVAFALVFGLRALESSAFVGFLLLGEVALVLGFVITHEGSPVAARGAGRWYRRRRLR